MTDPEPVRGAAEYQASLLDALGDDDPAEVQAATVATVRALIAEAGDDLRIRPEPSEWSVLECFGHMVDAELIVSARMRWIVSEDEPELVGYDQARWVDALRHGAGEPAALLDLFESLRRANLVMWAASSPAERARVGRHRERGRESYDLTFRLLAGHDRIHLAQARASLAAVRGNA
jgi:hypothetical protein